MSFQEKSAWAMLAALLITYGWYFADVLPQAMAGDIPLDAVDGKLLAMIVVVIVLSIIFHIVIAVTTGGEDEAEDERDRLISWRADARSSYALGLGAVGALLMMLAGWPVFWIAHTLLAGLVLSEIVRSVLRIADYRFGLRHG